MDAAKPKRRWLQFTLPALLLLILVVAAFLAGRASMYASLQQERQRAEAALERERIASLRTHREMFYEFRSRGSPSPFDGLPVDIAR